MGELFDLDGLTALVTGGGSGIGAAAAAQLAACGASVAVVDRDGAAAERVAEQIGAGARAVTADVSSPADCRAAVAQTTSAFGSLDALVLSHGIHGGGTVTDTSHAEWDAILAVNLTGAFTCLRAALPAMVEQRHGRVIGVSSDCAVRSCRDAAAYTTSKAGLVALIRSVAADYGAKGIRANVVTPGVVDTPLLRTAYSDDRDYDDSVRRAAAQSLVGRIGRPEDVAGAIAFLCSPAAGFITGAELLVDGGMTVSYGAD